VTLLDLNDCFIKGWKSSKVGTVQATKDMVKEAKKFIITSKTNGLTNIDAALTKAVKLLSSSNSRSVCKTLFQVKHRIRCFDLSLTPMIVFMTDGQANQGQTEGQKIVDKISRLMKTNQLRKCPIHSLAFGQGADYSLVQLLSTSNAGLRPSRFFFHVPKHITDINYIIRLGSKDLRRFGRRSAADGLLRRDRLAAAHQRPLRLPERLGGRLQPGLVGQQQL